jgi:peptide/nickel transport system permease protein
MARQAQNMIKYIIKRIFMIIPMLIATLILTWILSHMMSVNPVSNKIGQNMDPEVYMRELIKLGFYDPWYVQLGNYLKNFFTGNWGQSYIVQPNKPVLQLISEIFPKTIELMIIPIIIVPIVAVKLGVLSAKHKNKPKDTLIRGLAILGSGLPVFYIAALLQLFVGLSLKYFTYGEISIEVFYSNSPGLPSPFPPGGFSTGFRILDSIIYNDLNYLWDTLIHLLLPTICLLFVSLAGITRQTRSSMLDVLEQDYIRTARAKGVLEKDVINRHALRNALIPTSNLIIGNTAGMLLGSLFIETTFNYTGFGYWFVRSVFQGDYLVINGLLVFSVIIVLIGILVTDVMYTVIDPRISFR